MGRGDALKCSAALAGGLPEPLSPGGGGEEWRETLKGVVQSCCLHMRKISRNQNHS